MLNGICETDSPPSYIEAISQSESNSNLNIRAKNQRKSKNNVFNLSVPKQRDILGNKNARLQSIFNTRQDEKLNTRNKNMDLFDSLDNLKSMVENVKSSFDLQASSYHTTSTQIDDLIKLLSNLSISKDQDSTSSSLMTPMLSNKLTKKLYQIEDNFRKLSEIEKSAHETDHNSFAFKKNSTQTDSLNLKQIHSKENIFDFPEISSPEITDINQESNERYDRVSEMVKELINSANKALNEKVTLEIDTDAVDLLEDDALFEERPKSRISQLSNNDLALNFTTPRSPSKRESYVQYKKNFLSSPKQTQTIPNNIDNRNSNHLLFLKSPTTTLRRRPSKRRNNADSRAIFNLLPNTDIVNESIEGDYEDNKNTTLLRNRRNSLLHKTKTENLSSTPIPSPETRTKSATLSLKHLPTYSDVPNTPNINSFPMSPQITNLDAYSTINNNNFDFSNYSLEKSNKTAYLPTLSKTRKTNMKRKKLGNRYLSANESDGSTTSYKNRNATQEMYLYKPLSNRKEKEVIPVTSSSESLESTPSGWNPISSFVLVYYGIVFLFGILFLNTYLCSLASEKVITKLDTKKKKSKSDSE
ncbi:hypothetical protein BB559_001003 [Furculomyces boomerangus]|uniref:Uncharacterized protein n=1 Tax=Furculomyces boomerangus TaxID=61424 RepID=A0A2T9Z2C4_9FUNG|nr:hypothetical protein BB559_004496 [Furculomyces boomerangus]PVU98740.1 hypothetical protein BB559_001313 [Furculomyces boomerangus]PVU99106.1 hypothetical protein BB559_001003 [Furculomyces boomerangus]